MNEREGVALVQIVGTGRTADVAPTVLAIYDAHHRELASFIRGIERDPRAAADARTALLLAAHGFSGREVAEALGRTELATRSLICRARLRLREHLGGTEVPS